MTQIPLGQIWPHRGVEAWSPAKPEGALAYKTVGVDALRKLYDTDAHFVPYYVEGEPEVPRLYKEVADMDVPIRFRVVPLDCDPPGHARDAAWTDRFLSMLREKGWAGYITRGGGRVLFAADKPLTLQQYTVFQQRCAVMVEQAGFPVDPTCLGARQWGRCYRLPFVRRDGVDQRHPSVGLFPLAIPTLGFDDLPTALGSAPGQGTGGGLFAGVEDVPTPWKDIKRVGEGGRNDYLIRVAGSYRAKGLSGAALLTAIMEVNQNRCDPPVDVREVAELADKAERMWEAGGVAPEVEKPDNDQPMERGDETELAFRLIEELPDHTISAMGSLWSYSEEKGIWVAKSHNALISRSMDYAGFPVYVGKDKAGDPIYKPLNVSHRFANGAAKLAMTRTERAQFFDDEAHGVSFANGFYNVNGELVPHAPEHRARVHFPFNYDPSLQPVAFQSFLRSLWSTETETVAEVEDLVLLVRQIIAVFAVGLAPRYQRAFIALGHGANGKSVLLDVLASLFPDGEAVTAIPPQAWGKEYDRATLANSRVNIVSELPEVEMLASESIKGIISGDTTTARQIYGTPFKYKPRAGHIFSANALPGVRDHSGGFWRRWTVIPFPRTFLPHEQDKGITSRLIETQREAILCWALAALPEVVGGSGYAIPHCCEELTNQWRGSADQIACFFDEEPAFLNAWEMQSSQLYARYTEWAKLNGQRNPLSQRIFSERLKTRNGVHRRRTNKGVFFAGPGRAIAE